MSFNIIKLKKVQGKVSFDLNPKIHLLNQRANKPKSTLSVKLKSNYPSIRQSGSSTQRQRIDPSKSSISSPPKRIRVNPELLILNQSQKPKPATTLNRNTNPANLKKISEELSKLSQDIENQFLFITNHRKSITPPPMPCYRITKQSFPDMEVKIPRIKSKKHKFN